MQFRNHVYTQIVKHFKRYKVYATYIHDIKFGLLLVHENEISLRKYSFVTATDGSRLRIQGCVRHSPVSSAWKFIWIQLYVVINNLHLTIEHLLQRLFRTWQKKLETANTLAMQAMKQTTSSSSVSM